MEEKKEYNSYQWYNTITDDDLINTAIQQGIENIVNTSSIARITAINENTVDLELLNGDKLINVLVCSTAFNGWTVSLPLKIDDVGIVIFMKYEINEYKSSGKFQGESLSAFSINNGLFIPYALFNQPKISDDVVIGNNNGITLTINTDNEVIFVDEKDSGTFTINLNSDNELAVDNEKASILIDKDGGFSFENDKGTCSFDSEGVVTVSNNGGGEITMDSQGNITIKGSKAVIDASGIELGKSAVEPVILGNTFLQAMNQIITLLKTHTHGSNGGGPIAASPDLAAGLNPLQSNILSQVSKTT